MGERPQPPRRWRTMAALRSPMPRQTDDYGWVFLTSGDYRALSLEQLIEALRAERTPGRFAAVDRLVEELRARQTALERRNRELARAHRALERERNQLAELYAEAPVGYLSVDPDGRVLQANRTLLRLLGTGAEELAGLRFDRWVAADSRGAFRDQLRRLFENPIHRETALTSELTLQARGAGPIAARVQCTLAQDPDDCNAYARVAIIDISETKRAEQDLRAERDIAERLINTAQVIVALLDDQGRVVSANRYLEQLSGYGREDICGKDWVDLYVFPADLERARRAFSVDHSPEPGWSLTMDLRTRDGSRRTIEWRNTPIVQADGQTSRGVLCVGADVTEVRQLQRRERRQLRDLAHLGRVTLVDQLSTQLAHELNQPLTAILSYCHGMRRLLKAEPLDPPLLAEILDKIVEQTERTGRTIRHLRRFAARRTPELAPIDLNQCVNQALALSEIDLPEGTGRLEVRLVPEALPVCADALLIEQVIVNLIRNSLDAMAALPMSKRHLRIVTEALADTAELRVEDSGPGVSASVLDRIYRGFYTTKSDGLGLGLAISRNIVEMHNGELLGARGTGLGGERGMCFRLRLPVYCEGAQGV